MQQRAIQSRLNANGLSPYRVYPAASWPEAAAAGAWSGDSRGDAALTTAFTWDPANDHSVHLFAQTLTGTLSLMQVDAAGETPLALARGDFNHDGLDDLVTVNQDDDTLGIFLQNPGGGLGTMTAYPVGASPDGVAVGDFNGDLLDDLAVTHALSQTVMLYFQQTDGTLGAPQFLGLSSGGFNDLAAGDLNGDGYDDLVVMRGAGHRSSQVAVFYQQNRALTAPIFLTAEDGGFLTHGLAVGDVTGDGRDDIVVTAGGNTPNAFLNVFVQQSDGTLNVTPVVYPAFHLPEAVEIGDINHDGRNDVIAVHAAWMTLSVYTQTLTGTLHTYATYSLPYRDFYRPDSLALGDVTNDGALDVLVANHSSTAAENGLVVLENTLDAPTSTITLPAGGAYITNTFSYQIQGLASTTAVTIEVSTDGGRTWAAQAASPTWSFSWNVPAADGSYIILARAIDATGQVQFPPARTRVIVDRTAPSGALSIDGGATYTNNPVVTLSVIGSDFNGLDAMHFANVGGSYAPWVDFTAVYTWTLSGPDGVNTVQGQVRDVPSNPSPVFSDTIILDTTPPSCGVSINAGDAYANTTQVILTLSSADTYGVTQMRVRNASGSWSAWQTYATTLNWNLTGGDATKTVDAQFMDVAGNTSAVCSDTIILDTTPPVCSLSIDGGVTYTSQPTVTLSITGTDVNGVSLMRFSNDAAAWSAWSVYASTSAWTLDSPPDGSKTVYGQVQDAAGNDSANCQDAIILDTTLPTGFVIIDGGASYTGVPTVTLTLGASDTYGVSQMRFSNDNVSWGTWQSYATSASWVLSNGDGSKTVYVEFQDVAGNISSPITDDIILDTTPPDGAIVINGNATYTTIPTVTLTITATDQIPVMQMRLSNDGTTWDAWEPYATSRVWTLSSGDGMKSVYVQFQDSVGNTSAVLGDAIVLDTTAPSCSIFINGGDAVTTQPDVTLNVSCSDSNPPLQVRYSNDGANWTPWEAYNAVKSWTLSAGDGTKTVYIQAQDTPGNTSASFMDDILLDTTPPSCTLQINDDAVYATSLDATLAITCTDTNGMNQIRMSDDGSNWIPWQAYVTSLPWTLPPGDGMKTVYMEASDIPGNVTAPVTDTIILDTVLPSGGCDVADDNGYVNTPNVTLSLWSYDDNGVPDMQIRNAGTSWGDWIPFASSPFWTLPTGDGGKSVECRFRDTPGNVSPVYTATVFLDTVQPTCQIAINGGVQYVNDIQVTLVVSGTDNIGMQDMRFSDDGVAWSSWQAYGNSAAWQLPLGDGNKTVWAQMRDLAGNVQQCSDSATLDTEPPTGTISLENGADYTSAVTVTISLSATDSSSGMDAVCINNDGPPCVDWQPYASSMEWVLPATEGIPQEVCAWFRDNANNASATPSCDAIILDSTPPTGTISINAGDDTTAEISVVLTLASDDASSGVCNMQIRNAGTAWAEWLPYTTSYLWELEDGLGEQSVEVRYRDCVGNVSPVYTDTITRVAVIYLPLAIR